MQDKEIKCIDCPNLFIFTAKDQAFYKDKGFKSPKRCLACRDRKKKEKYPNEYHPPVQEEFANDYQNDGGYSEPRRDRSKGDRRRENEW